MEAKAVLKYVRTSPRKTRLVVDAIRGKKVAEALNILTFINKKPARAVKKLLKSAVANAEEKKIDDVESLSVSRITVDGGSIWKRQLPRGRGRATPIKKRTSHITIVLKEV
ncbi:MAG: 50S ribosomal protein L22 [Nitrospinae bacterium]|nr:50S ribosomal protein L22 [Nitrospinota bacterium]